MAELLTSYKNSGKQYEWECLLALQLQSSVLTAARIAIIIAIISYPDGHLQRVHDSDGVYGGAEKGREGEGAEMQLHCNVPLPGRTGPRASWAQYRYSL